MGELSVKISVVVTAYDEGPLVEQAIRSVLEQTGTKGLPRPDFEVIAVHDYGADPTTVVILQRLSRESPQIRVIENRSRAGCAGARNTGIEEATGDWIAFLDGDDVWLPLCLAERWRAIRAHPGVDWLAADIHRGPQEPPGIDRSERTQVDSGFFGQSAVYRRVLDEFGGPLDPEGSQVLSRPVRSFRPWTICHTSAVMVRRVLLAKTGGFVEWLTRAEDTNLWMRLAGRADLIFIRRPLTWYRIRASTVARRGASRRGWAILGTLDLFRHPHMARWFWFLYRTRLVWCLNAHVSDMRERGRFGAAALAALLSVAAWPFQKEAWRGFLGSLLRRG